MNRQTSKIINAVLAILAIICFLTMDFYGLGANKNITGAKLLELCVNSGEFAFWPVLFIIIPIVQILIRTTIDSIGGAVLSSLLMFIPPLAALGNINPEMLQIGFYVHVIISFIMVLIPGLESNKPKNEVTIAETGTTGSKQKEDARNKSDEQLLQIIDNPAMYNKELVEACKSELDIRTNSKSLMPEVESYSKEKINEILWNKETYSAALIYCCEKVKAERAREEVEQARKKAEELRLEQERIAKEKIERQKAFWLKWRWVIIGSTATVISILAFFYFTSNGYYYSSGVGAYNSDNYEAAIEKLSNIDDKEYPMYLEAKYYLAESYRAMNGNDSVYTFDEDALKAIRDIYNAVKDLEIEELENLYDKYASLEAYHLCADMLLTGRLKPDYVTDYHTAAKLYELIDADTYHGVTLYHLGDYEKAYELLEDIDNRVSSVYKGMMRLKGNGCKQTTRGAYDAFKDVEIEHHLFFNSIEDENWVILDGEPWNGKILREYLVAKGDLNLIYGVIRQYGEGFGSGIARAKECYAELERLYPYNKDYVTRHKYINSLYNIKGEISTTGDYSWHYRGEYIKDWSYMNGIRPYGTGLYYEYKKDWATGETRKRVAIGNFGKSGSSFTWGEDAMIIYRNSDDTAYYVGYYDENGEYHFMSEYK